MFTLKVGYERPDLGDGDGVNPFAGREVSLAKFTGEMLNKYYPGHPWNVRVTLSKMDGIIQIQLMAVMPPDRWYALYASNVFHDPGGRRTVLRAGGELLERYNLPRQKFSLDQWRGAVELIPIKGRGNLEPLR